MADYIIIALLGLLFAFIIRRMLKGKGGCSGCTGQCPGCKSKK